jgi:nitrate reductase gamma subunit
VSDTFFFVAFPYLAVALAVGGVVYRRRALDSTVTARSSQLLEGRLLFWGSVPWHTSILAILAAHVAATVCPQSWARLLGSASRLYVLEVTGLALGLWAVLGIVLLLLRRLSLAGSTSVMDWAVLLALALQAVTGAYVAYTLRWGGAWYVHTPAPWLASLATFSPRIERMAVLPTVVKVHAVNAFVLIALLPLSKLVHVTTIPLAYLWRPPQLVMWRRAPKGETR